MNRAIVAAFIVSCCLIVAAAILTAGRFLTAQATEPAPCVLPVPMPAEIEHGAESVTEAMLESAFGSELEGKPQ